MSLKKDKDNELITIEIHSSVTSGTNQNDIMTELSKT
jgi:hypothetical protein